MSNLIILQFFLIDTPHHFFLYLSAMKEFRNRVAVVTGAASDIGRALAKSFLDVGMDPIEVARQVIDAIHEERFYVITHDFNSYIETRMKNILSVNNPELMPPPEDLLNLIQEQTQQQDKG
jgi:NAD(P)-dependent dehydrogenase (short-subunit alcohol dehydrogenase family)